MNTTTMSQAGARHRSWQWFGLANLASMPLWARLVILTAAGLVSLVGSSIYFSSALHQTAERTSKMKQLLDIVGGAGEAHVRFGELRYWLTDLSVSQLVISERNAIAARGKFEANLDLLLSYDPETISSIRAEVEAYVSKAMQAADAYTDGNRVIGNTFLASARAHSRKVDAALNELVMKVTAAASAERQLVVASADRSARAAIYAVIVLSLIGFGLTALVLRSIVQPIRRLNEAITALMQGRYEIEIPTEEDYEFGAMAQTLRRFRENALERERLEAQAERQKQRLIEAEKMASLGQLTAGIAHEIKNPLNFVNNFAKLSEELIAELSDILHAADGAPAGEARGDVDELLQTVRGNLRKINEHGGRADSIVKNMLLHSRAGPSELQSANINAIAEEALNLAYHGQRASHPGFNIEMIRRLSPAVGEIECFPQDLMRVLLNLISNGMYAASMRAKKAETGADFTPTLTLTTRADGDRIEIEVRDNGDGIAAELRARIFMPFFTTKPAGEGTGLGLSLSYDIVVKEHEGELTVDSRPGEFTAFRVALPRTLATVDEKQR